MDKSSPQSDVLTPDRLAIASCLRLAYERGLDVERQQADPAQADDVQDKDDPHDGQTD